MYSSQMHSEEKKVQKELRRLFYFLIMQDTEKWSVRNWWCTWRRKKKEKQNFFVCHILLKFWYTNPYFHQVVFNNVEALLYSMYASITTPKINHWQVRWQNICFLYKTWCLSAFSLQASMSERFKMNTEINP